MPSNLLKLAVNSVDELLRIHSRVLFSPARRSTDDCDDSVAVDPALGAHPLKVPTASTAATRSNAVRRPRRPSTVKFVRVMLRPPAVPTQQIGSPKILVNFMPCVGESVESGAHAGCLCVLRGWSGLPDKNAARFFTSGAPDPASTRSSYSRQQTKKTDPKVGLFRL